MARSRHITILLLALASFAVLPSRAWALTCSGGSASGDIFTIGGSACGSFGLDRIFSRIFCDFVNIINDVLGKVYCAIQYELEGILAILFTVYIAVFGAQILMGSVQLGTKEIMLRLLKVAGVWMFATQTYWAIGRGFQFFVQMAIYGAWWFWGGAAEASCPSGGSCDVYNVGFGSSGTVMSVFSFFDQVIYDTVTGPFTMAHSEVIGFFFVMWYLVPTLFMLAAYWLWMSFSILVRGLLTFLISVASLAYLLALSPIFLSFMLFASTYQFFENWLKYMMSYTVQVIVIFAIIALWLASVKEFTQFFDELAEVLFPYDSLWVESAAKSDPVSTWGICPIQYSQDPLRGPTVACEDSGFDPINDPNDRPKMIPASRIAQQGEFVYYIIYRLLVLIIIAYAFDALARQAPMMAKSLAGPEYVPILGQGYEFSKYGVVNKTPEWVRKGYGGGKSLIQNADKTLGISKTAREAISGMSSRYTDSMRDMLTRR